LLYCEKMKFRRIISPSMCAICSRINNCKVFWEYYNENKRDYIKFVLETVKKFPEKYKLGVILMAEKKQFAQIVDKKTGKIEKVVEMSSIDNLTEEEKLELTKGKVLYIVTHIIEPVLRVEMVRTRIEDQVEYKIEE